MNKEHLLPIEKSRLGVIGGSGFYSMDQIDYLREIEINTPYGKPSDSIRVYSLGNLEIAFIPRHGRTHRLNPTEIPYKANIWALRSIGVRWIVAPSAVGSLQEQIIQQIEVLVEELGGNMCHSVRCNSVGRQSKVIEIEYNVEG